MLQALPELLAKIEEQKKNTMYGQVGFFEIGDDDSSKDFEFTMPDVPEFPHSELLSMEKDMTGLYLSGHPMDKYDDIIEQLHYPHISSLLEAGSNDSEFNDQQVVTVAGSISALTRKQTKNGSDMAFVEIEDMYANIEIIVFPNVYETCSNLLNIGNIITVNGRLSVEDESTVRLISSVVSGPPQLNMHNSGSNEKKTRHTGLYLRFESKKDPNMKKVQNLLSIFDGTCPLYFYYKDQKKYDQRPQNEFVSVNETLKGELKRILGKDNVVQI